MMYVCTKLERNAQDLSTVCSFPEEQEKVETLLGKAEELQVLTFYFHSRCFLLPKKFMIQNEL